MRNRTHHLIVPYATGSSFQGRADLFRVCMVCSCCRVIRFGFYWRVVEDGKNRVSRVRIQRYRCKGCSRTFSRPPASVVAYKRFNSRAIERVLELHFAKAWSIARVCKALLYGSYSSFRRWVRGFTDRSESIRSDGLVRLGVGGDCGPMAADVLRGLCECCGPGESVLERVQPVLMGSLPQLGVFHSFEPVSNG